MIKAANFISLKHTGNCIYHLLKQFKNSAFYLQCVCSGVFVVIRIKGSSFPNKVKDYVFLKAMCIYGRFAETYLPNHMP